MVAAEQVQAQEYTLTIERDDNAENPREWADHMGTMVCRHNRYQLGDTEDLPEDWSQVVALPLYLMDHSGLAMHTDSSVFRACDAAAWDWGCVGVIYVTKDAIRREYGCKRITQQVRAKVLQALEAEVQEYDHYLQGEVYGYVVTDQEGEVVDSCWGFYGYERACEEGKLALEWFVGGSMLAY